MLRLFLTAILLTHSAFSGAQTTRPNFPQTELSIGMFRIQAEVAASESFRNYGLMHRKEMPINAGMIFVFKDSQAFCMWMKNTLLPLSVAFLDETGKIINIADMQPLSEQSHCAARPARFALEMNKGWFKSKNFKPGTKVQGLERFGATP